MMQDDNLDDIIAQFSKIQISSTPLNTDCISNQQFLEKIMYFHHNFSSFNFTDDKYIKIQQNLLFLILTSLSVYNRCNMIQKKLFSIPNIIQKIRQTIWKSLSNIINNKQRQKIHPSTFKRNKKMFFLSLMLATASIVLVASNSEYFLTNNMTLNCLLLALPLFQKDVQTNIILFLLVELVYTHVEVRNYICQYNGRTIEQAIFRSYKIDNFIILQKLICGSKVQLPFQFLASLQKRCIQHYFQFSQNNKQCQKLKQIIAKITYFQPNQTLQHINYILQNIQLEQFPSISETILIFINISNIDCYISLRIFQSSELSLEIMKTGNKLLQNLSIKYKAIHKHHFSQNQNKLLNRFSNIFNNQKYYVQEFNNESSFSLLIEPRSSDQIIQENMELKFGNLDGVIVKVDSVEHLHLPKLIKFHCLERDTDYILPKLDDQYSFMNQNSLKNQF